MFTIKDVCDIAVQIERNGEATYRQAAKAAADDKIKTILSRMADDEQQHGRWFAQIVMNDTAKHTDSEMEAMGRNLLQDMVKGQSFTLDAKVLSETTDMGALFKQSIEFEQDTITFYEMLLEFVVDEQVRRHVALIVQEERDHIEQLRKLNELLSV